MIIYRYFSVLICIVDTYYLENASFIIKKDDRWDRLY